MSDAILGLMETMAKEYSRDVSLTRVRSHGSWRVECAGVIAQSQVSPEDAMIQLATELDRRGISRNPTTRMARVARKMFA